MAIILIQVSIAKNLKSTALYRGSLNSKGLIIVIHMLQSTLLQANLVLFPIVAFYPSYFAE